MSLGDVYGKTNRSGIDKQPNLVSRSSEDGTPESSLMSADEILLHNKEREIASIDKQVSTLKRELVNADLRKTPDRLVYNRVKAEVDAKLKVLDMSRRRLGEEITRIKRSKSIKRHL